MGQYDRVQKILEVSTIEKKFKDLRKEYDTSISLLNLIDFKKFNSQEEDKLLKEDTEKMQKFLADLAKKSIAEILNEVTELYKTAQHNKNITKILMQRIAAANSAASILRDVDLKN